MKLFKLTFYSSVILLLCYLGLGVVWAWQVTLPLAHEALNSPHEEVSGSHIEDLLQVEDPSFYQHIGLDWSKGQGTTTLTMRVAEILFFEGERLRGWQGRLQAIYQYLHQCCVQFDPAHYARALVVDWRLTKFEQVRIFMSNAYMGQFQEKPIYGFPVAALVYFKTPLEHLDKSQWLSLVALVLDPEHFDPVANAPRHKERVERIERLLSGLCRPQMVSDVELENCARVDLAGEPPSFVE